MSSLVQSVDWLAIAPPTITAVVGLVVLVADLFIGDAKKAVLGWVSVAGLAVSALMLLPILDGDRATFCLTGDKSACSYTADRFTLVIQFLVLGGALLTALLSVTALKDANRELPEGEFWFLLLSSAAGAALLPASATSRPSSSPWKSPPCPPSRSSASSAATRSPPKRP